MKQWSKKLLARLLKSILNMIFTLILSFIVQFSEASQAVRAAYRCETENNLNTLSAVKAKTQQWIDTALKQWQELDEESTEILKGIVNRKVISKVPFTFFAEIPGLVIFESLMTTSCYKGQCSIKSSPLCAPIEVYSQLYTHELVHAYLRVSGKVRGSAGSKEECQADYLSFLVSKLNGYRPYATGYLPGCSMQYPQLFSQFEFGPQVIQIQY